MPTDLNSDVEEPATIFVLSACAPQTTETGDVDANESYPRYIQQLKGDFVINSSYFFHEITFIFW